MSTASLNTILKGRRSQPHQLVEVLQDVQDLYGYVPGEAMKTVARELGVPIIEVCRVANFYKTFSLRPRGKHVITVCTGTACHVRGADLLLDQIQGQLQINKGDTSKDGLFTIESVNCVGACALGPVIARNGTYDHHMTPAKLRKMIDNTCRAEKEEVRHG